MAPLKSLVAETATRNQIMPFTLRVREGERLKIKAESPHLSMAEKLMMQSFWVVADSSG